MLKKSICVLAAITAFQAPMTASAGTQKNVTLNGAGCLSDGFCFAKVSPNLGPESCDIRNQIRWDATTSIGKNFTATILTAQASGSSVNIGFNDTNCTTGNTPELEFVTIN